MNLDDDSPEKKEMFERCTKVVNDFGDSIANHKVVSSKELLTVAASISVSVISSIVRNTPKEKQLATAEMLLDNFMRTVETHLVKYMVGLLESELKGLVMSKIGTQLPDSALSEIQGEDFPPDVLAEAKDLIQRVSGNNTKH